MLIPPFSGTTLATLAKEVAGYSQTKSSLHFDPKRGLPATLVRKLIRARIAELGRKLVAEMRGCSDSESFAEDPVLLVEHCPL